jgi:hypothetical protein
MIPNKILAEVSKLAGIPLDDLMPPDYSQYEPPDTLFKTGSPLFNLDDAYRFQTDGLGDQWAVFAFRLGYEAAVFDVCLKQGGAFCLFAHAGNVDRLVARAKLFGRTTELDGDAGWRMRTITVSAQTKSDAEHDPGIAPETA